eukprot:TRINITY_DN797_c0_g2_i1.p1 TRINITY_DN797_c0_g2~~TRINITY_DN797_c0_g2_i1.p1  ORF type:complete len:415 (-),score=43.76 TRINITY_DN797_c0_g2_i1:32-1246(-)
MHWIQLFALLFLTLSLSFGQNTTETTGNPASSSVPANGTIAATNATKTVTLPPYFLDCRLTPSSVQVCSGKGVCSTDGKCRCFIGWFRYYNGDCSISIRLVPGADKALTVIRIFNGVAFGILLLLTAWRIFIEFRNRYSGDFAPIRNLTKFALGMLFLYCFFNFLGCLDWYGVYGVISHAGYIFIYVIPFPIALCLFSAIILHWIELYNVSTLTLRREEMIQKINSNYNPTVSLEDILLKVSFLRKFKVFFGVIVSLSLAFVVVFFCLYFYVKNYDQYWYYFNFFMVYFLLCWVCLGAGFVLYGVRMYRIMPDIVKPKIFSITVLAIMTVIFLIIENCTVISIFHSKSASNDFFIKLITFNVLRFLQVLCALNIYMPLWNWKNWFHSSAITSRDPNSIDMSVSA